MKARLIPSCVALALAACSSPPPPKAAPMTTETKQPDIVQIGRPVLRARASEVPAERLGTPELRDLVKRMIATMRAAPGVGLAAPQIGVPWRVIVLEDRADLQAKLTDVEKQERERVPFEPRVFVNPVLRTVGDERATFFEGCLSVRGYVGMVERAREVEVTGVDENGAPQTWHVRGWPARILQHEVDHLDGTIYVDRMITRSFTNADHAKELYAGKPVAEVRRLLGI
jgi:peptide deformylase